MCREGTKMKKSYLKSIGVAIILLTLAIGFISFPKDVLAASLRGLNIWWGIVFPSLLPFLIISDLFISFGVVALIGGLLEPIMRPLFRVPGVGGFVFALGMISGFPSGAKMTATLRKQGMLTRTEAERLVCYTNSSNPLFIFGAIAVGFFHEPQLGALLALAHYGGNFGVGLLMRFYKIKEINVKAKRDIGYLKNSVKSMHNIRVNETRPFGKILGDAVSSSIQTLLMIGGFIILFSVLNKLLFNLGFITFMVGIFSSLFRLLTISTHLISPIIAGFFEVTLGSQMACNSHSTLYQTVVAVSGLLGFSGLSVHAQVASILAETDIQYKIFFFAKLVHSVLAMSIAAALFKHLNWVNDVFYIEANHSLYTPFFKLGPIITIISIVLFCFLYIKKKEAGT
ncbi:MAG: ylbJ [Bacillales bacterium]|jgi:sporulation integral membrane protein YlbJ|nr:ylbJ [Bacillales bacterium]